ncbi:sugar phosphate isomerase/epimerase [Microbacterium sp. Marseille-Q6965]|uniref:sugar phosphate isomerase/epimerase family protein n=1 Tax=Microbacterium sp. Marseille-Q6965 TaxID=2965072 RepID=UPI0021B76E8A|nr:sugar phosphate isomerase/epimerase [Microbacterium sp. Marseille-Q6965]
MQIGCHGLVWAGTVEPDDVEKAVTKTLDAGFDLLEMPLFDPESFDVDAARAVLSAHPIAVSASMGQTADSDPHSEDPACVQAAERKLLAAIDVLEALGAQYFVGALYTELRKYEQPATRAARAHAVGVVQTAADRAAEAGITLGLEVVNRYETNLFNTGRGALAFLDEVDRPNVGVHLDTYHMNIEESDMAQPVLDCADRLVYVHVGESHRGYLGSGTVDFDGFFKALVRVGYDGPITFESFSTAVVHDDLSRMLAIWRNLWDDSEDLGAHANAFIRGRIRAAETIALH